MAKSLHNLKSAPAQIGQFMAGKALIEEEPKATRARLDAIIKNTYRTLMTRGQKGCYVYFIDNETRQFFEKYMEANVVSQKIPIAISLSEETTAAVVLPFRRLSLKEVRPFENCVPLYDLKVAAGKFSDEQQVAEKYAGLGGQDIQTMNGLSFPMPLDQDPGSS